MTKPFCICGCRYAAHLHMVKGRIQEGYCIDCGCDQYRARPEKRKKRRRYNERPY